MHACASPVQPGTARRPLPPRGFLDGLFGSPSTPATSAPPSGPAAEPWLARLVEGTILEAQPLALAYDASRDGWTASAFHRRVDNRGPLLLLAESAGGARFGAFTPLGFASREDYRDSNSTFLFRWADGADWQAEEPEYLLKTGAPALFDFSAQGPCFGADALRIPLGLAPPNGSSYAGVGGSTDLGKGHAAGTRAARSRLGSHYARRGDGGATLFGDAEGMDAELTSLRCWVSPGREGMYM